MSSSHQNDQQINETDLKMVSKTSYNCPQCGKQKMRRVVGPCDFENGDFIPTLERMHCFSCGADFFDPPAMDAIEEFWKTQKLKSVQAQARRSKKTKSTLYSEAA